MTGNPKILTTILNDFRILYFLIQFLDFLVNPWVRPPTPRAKPNLPPWSINHQPLLYLCDVHFSWIYQRGHCVTATVPLILANTTPGNACWIGFWTHRSISGGLLESQHYDLFGSLGRSKFVGLRVLLDVQQCVHRSNVFGLWCHSQEYSWNWSSVGSVLSRP